MFLDQILAIGLYGFVCVFSVVFMWKRRRWRRSGSGFRPSVASLGNALHQLQAIAEPQIRHVIEEKDDDALDDENDGGPDDPVRHLHRQARKIRRGEKLENLTVRLRKR